ncbi:MAG: hypothetical protein ACJAVV_003018 [Alphaproteobacteria bacterium]|jgi:uncharacterized protein (TIGR02001 family)
MLTGAFTAATLLLVAPLQAQESAYPFSENTGLYSDYLWSGIDLNNGDLAFQDDADYKLESAFYPGLWSSQYDVGNGGNGAKIDFYAGYSFSTHESFNIDFAVTNYQFTGESQNLTEFRLGVSYDIATINLHRDIDLKSTYFEMNLSHSINEQFSVNTRVGRNENGSEYFYDYAISGDYAVTDIVSLILGYSNQDLGADITGSQVFAGTSISF